MKQLQGEIKLITFINTIISTSRLEKTPIHFLIESLKLSFLYKEGHQWTTHQGYLETLSSHIQRLESHLK